MSRILAIDFGTKRMGLAVTDPHRIIASPLATVASHELMPFLRDYVPREGVSCIVVGEPKRLDNTRAQAADGADLLAARLHKAFPEVRIERMDERFTSKMASAAMLQGGLSRKQRADKATIDRVSAAILLQSFLESGRG